MRILVTGAAGFVGGALIRHLRESIADLTVIGLDNLGRPGSEHNRSSLRDLGVEFHHGDVRLASDFETLPPVDWVIDAAANASVLAGADGKISSRQVIENNLAGTINMLEYCRRCGAGFILLSTSRVYSIPPLSALALTTVDDAFQPALSASAPPGVGMAGITEAFSTAAPVSLYGASKLASEALALEYGAAYGFEVWVNRCGVLAGAGQFGRPDQGIFSFWLHAFRARRPLRYIGFGGSGHQVRDCLHPRDLATLLRQQLTESAGDRLRVQNVAGGAPNALSLAQLTRWCGDRFGPHDVGSDDAERPFDLPWVVLDSALASAQWDWAPEMGIETILEEIATHADAHPSWLDLSCG